MASESSTPEREFLPASYYEPFISNVSKARRPSPIRGLYPLESIPGMISLLAGKPAPQTFPVTSISVTVRSPFDLTQETQLTIKDEALAESLQYTATKGITSLVNWMDRLQQIYHNRYSSGEGWGISVGTGSQDLLYKAFHALLNPGDPIFIEAPVYGGVIPILEALRCELIDDPYYYLYYGEQERPPSYFKLETEDGHPVGQVVRFDSLSKIISAGLRLGFVSGPSRVVDAIAIHTSSANLQTSSTAQAIAFAMLSHFGYEGFEKHTEYVSQYYRQKRDVFEAAMNEHLTGLVEWSSPVSGMFIWYVRILRPTANSPEGDSAALIRERAVAQGVLALPGTAFFPNGQTSAYVRAAFSLLEPEDVDEAMRRLALVITEYNAEGE
ncbi:hypothetical protein M407DRAFT_64463 [Tulasnella calospora MUT 4182]|uniref:Aminotransferase class I/classII large domain-containing protein n=1 Tax=Tulasnella calospora MUT 4182 TaxID=1051891 RepID=A0A0C3ML46_9AGAM|nr:hypothetical protein M407DRAFT_64463 [Tulasnella calospora MUT 4182]